MILDNPYVSQMLTVPECLGKLPPSVSKGTYGTVLSVSNPASFAGGETDMHCLDGGPDLELLQNLSLDES